MAETITRVRGGQAGIGNLSGQSTELSENINPVALGTDLTQNIVNSQASLSTDIQDNKFLLGDTETFSKAQSAIAGVAAGALGVSRLGTALAESTTGFDTAATLASLGATAAGLAAILFPGVSLVLVAGSVVLSTLTEPFEELGRVQRANREAQFLASRNSARINKR